MKKFFLAIFGMFAVGTGVTIGIRMSADAMAVIIGVIFGLVATIPTTFILIYTLRRQDSQQKYQQQQSGQYPPVIVVNSSPQGAAASGGFGAQSLLPSMGERNFKVVGQESTTSETLGDAFNLKSIWDEV